MNQFSIQKLISHKVVHKVYNLGDDIFIESRSSINELIKNKIKLFNSQNLKNKIEKEEEEEKDIHKIDRERIKKISKIIKESFKLNLFGFDILIEKDTNQYYLIDLNHFPGYKNVDQFNELFLKFLKSY